MRAASLRFGFVASMLLDGACATIPPQAEPPLPPGRLVLVSPGQSLREIADDSGVSVAEIIEVNGLRDVDDIVVGQQLWLPQGRMSRVSERAPVHAPARVAQRPTSTKAPAALASTPLLWPVDGIVLRDFATTGKRPYDGVLIGAPRGTTVHAAAAGHVAFAGSQETNYGVVVIVEHADDVVTVYAHLARAEVRAGDAVAAGDVLGEVGTTGLSSSEPRVQFQVRRARRPIDPLPLLPP